MTGPNPKLDELIATAARLRAPGGCAWDREQTHESLVQYLVEESYELIEAIESGSREELIEELGDVLYQVLFHADIEAEAGSFTLEDVAEHMTAKMVIASANRLMPVRHFCRKRNRIAEINVPACPIPTQKTKLVMS